MVLERLREAIDRWSVAAPADVLARWRELSDTIGKRVRVELPDRVVEGKAGDIDDSGNLVVDGVLVSAGSLTLLDG
jgi:BirA family biotin operon repressor/biotin-[acetyl-CoA-carboxylase] ligase